MTNSKNDLLTKLDGLNDKELAELQRNLTHLIDHIANRIEYAETRRSNIAILGSTVVAASIAILTLVLTNIDYVPIKSMLICMSMTGIIFGALVLFVFAKQTNFRYPFTKVAQTRKWFYRYSLRNYEAFTAPFIFDQSEKDFQKSKDEYASQWTEFYTNNIEDLKDLRKNIAQDLEQVYLMHVNERYKNLFLTQLRSIFSYGIVITVVLGILALLIGFMFN